VKPVDLPVEQSSKFELVTSKDRRGRATAIGEQEKQAPVVKTTGADSL
jgi:hypothetical protein